MAVISAAIANNGSLMQPYLVDTVRDARLDVVTQNSPHQVRQAISASTAASLRSMMVDAVQRGTATSAQISGVQVAAKTGTAQWATGAAPHAWITAFAPAENPRVAVAVIVEAGGNLGSEATGGRVSGPIARAVVEAALNR
jgi:peptidoglycan glycosyltransferase